MKTGLLSLNSLVVQTKGHVASDMDGSKVMLSIEKGKYYNLGRIGGVIWDLIESPIKIDTIITQLCTDYEVEEGVCKEQVVAFIDHLLREELVTVFA